MITRFKDYLAKTNLAKNTVASYVWTVNYFLSHYGEVNKKNLLAYKGYLVENFKPQTVNLRLQGINKYLEFIKQDKLKVKFIKVQQKNFLENVISDADYKFLKTRLKADDYDDWYFVVWFMAATGARVSELLHIKVEHVKVGYLDLYSKGGKIRRLYIPKNLRSEAIQWLKSKNMTSGYIFLNRFGQRITTRESMNEQVYLHLHITVGRSDYSALAGHLLSAIQNGAGEFVVEDYSERISRTYNPDLGLNIYDFER